MAPNVELPPLDNQAQIVLDEGYSEHPLSTLSRNNMALPPSGRAARPRGLSRPTPQALAAASMNIDVDDRISLVIQLLRSMPAAKVQDIVNAMYPVLHISFLDRLPPEVCLKILYFLDPNSLISLAQTSKLGANLSSDWTLWRNLYYREGFLTNDRELAEVEVQLKKMNERAKETVHSRPTTSSDGPPSKKRSRPTASASERQYSVGDSDMIDVDPAFEERRRERASIFGATSMSSTDTAHTDRDDFPSDMPILSPSSMSPSSFTRKQSSASSTSGHSKPDFELTSTSSLTTLDRHNNERRLNWQFLYNQRRKLESNWLNDRYTNYQIPHPDHPEEAHTQCIYAIQHDGRNLVSASRDQTIRIWSLDTCRLIRKPLTGHSQSVLCVQFDADPAEDIIVSGSADCTIRIWQFSTGKMKQVMRNAHRSAILNLKFDKRILVTCSRDRTLKIFNRRTLYPGDFAYPLPQDFVFKPVPQVVNFPGMVPSPYGDLQPLTPYNLIGTLEGHGAAVNACSIYGDEVVSVSGDRLAKIWNWPSGACTRSLVGHTKGVASVWYDGTRVVTSASDCEIKVFDRATGVEVASLKGPGGHRNLVRTVQAGFNDVGLAADRAEEYKNKALQVDKEFFGAWQNRPEDSKTKWAMDQRRGGKGNAGSDRPEDIVCYGATLPPGGGGGKYARIVSGSYDEMIIIWRRDHFDAWKPKTVLKQADAGRAALLNVELNRPPTHQRDELDEVLAGMGTQPGTSQHGTSRWCRELVEKLVLRSPEALRQGITHCPVIMEHVTRMLGLIRTLAGTVSNEEGTRVLMDGGMAIRNRMRAIVHAAMCREMDKVQNSLVELEKDDLHCRHEMEVAQESLLWARRAEMEEVEEYRQEDALWTRRLEKFGRHNRGAMMQVRQVSSGFEDFENDSGSSAEAHATPPHAADPASMGYYTDPNNFPGPPPVSNPNIPSTWIPMPRSMLAAQAAKLERAAISRLAENVEIVTNQIESTRAHQRALKRMLDEVEAPAHTVAPAEGELPQAAAQTESHGRVYKLQFDARRIVAASSNPIILVWDFASGDREIEEASRFFRGVE